jgi:glycosyltransferase involved in cell wall biosynthesis
LLVAPFPPAKGPEAEKAYYLCRALLDHGWKVHVGTAAGAVDCDHPRAHVHPVMRDWSWSDAGALAALVERSLPDVVVVLFIDWMYHYHPMMTFFPTIARALRPSAKVVTIFEDVGLGFPWEQPFDVRLGRQRSKRWAHLSDVDDRYGTLLRDSDRVVVVSGRVGDRLEQYQSGLKHKMVVAPTPPILRMAPRNERARQERRERLGLKSCDFLLAYFGYVSQGKGVEHLLAAFAELSQKRGDIRLVLIGGTIPEQEHIDYAREMHVVAGRLGIEDRIHWTGDYAWDSDEPSQLLWAADLCVLPYDAGVSIHNCSFAGAAAHELPIVTTRGDQLDEQFVNRDNVLLCPPQNAEALARAIETLLNDLSLRERLRAGVGRLVRDCFSWDVALGRMGLLLPSAETPR